LGSSVNLFFLLWAAALVFFMQTGFAMLCAGSIRSKNIKNVILWNLLDSCGAGISYWAVGFAFSFGGDDVNSAARTFIGSSQFFVGALTGVDLQFWLFQWAFASAVSSIVAGTIAERTQMKAYLIYSTFLIGFAYPVVAHAMWSTQGFASKFTKNLLFGSGAIDLAGSGTVHMFGGMAAVRA
jgi:Amt family ammonium transporter